MSWLNSLGARMEELAASQKHVNESQAQTEANLSALTEIVSDLGRAQTRTEAALTALTQRVDSLAETVERHVNGHS
jgi:flagellin-like hook-associated protein FlgL